MLRDGTSLSDWQRGFLIHTFGDTYAHTDSGGDAYNFYTGGHLWRWTDPDIIALRPGLYAKYANDLCRTLHALYGGKNGSPTGCVRCGQLANGGGDEDAVNDRLIREATGDVEFPSSWWNPSNPSGKVPSIVSTPSTASVQAFLKAIRCKCADAFKAD